MTYRRVLTVIVWALCVGFVNLQPARAEMERQPLSLQDWDKLAITTCQKLQPQAKNCKNALIDRRMDSHSFDGPLVIRKGGTYTGAWRSDDPNVNTVTILTSEPVVIKDSIIVGRGNLIYGRNVNAHIMNVSGFGLGERVGKFLDVTVNKILEVSDNRMSKVWGMRVSGQADNLINPPKIAFLRNIAYNLTQGSESRAHFIQLSGGHFPAAEILGNTAINAPWKSHVEDVINIYNAWGNAEQPISVRGNKILGAYPPDPSVDGFSGGGIIVDGNGGKATASAHILIEENVVISTTNYGIAIASGHNNTIKKNIIVSSGLVSPHVPIKAQNVGVYIWNIGKQEADVFFGNAAFRNKVFWMKVTNPSTSSQTVNHVWLPDCKREYGACSNDILSTSTLLRDAIKLEQAHITAHFGED